MTQRTSENGTIRRRLLMGGGLAAMATGGAVASAATAGAAPPGDPWLLGGNLGVTPDNALGTNDATALVLRTNAVERLRVTPTGRVGIGTTAPVANLTVRGTNGIAVRAQLAGRAPTSIGVQGLVVEGTAVQGVATGALGAGVVGRHHSTTGSAPGVLGETDSASADASGVLGRVTPTAPGPSSGVRGVNNGTGGTGVGMWGSHAGSGYGVLGTTEGPGVGVRGEGGDGLGVEGIAGGGTATGVVGRHTSAGGTGPGVLGETNSFADNAAGVVGRVNQDDPGASSGVWGINNGTGASGVGVWGSHAGTGYGVLGTTAGAGTGVRGEGADGTGVHGVGRTGVSGVGTGAASTGVVAVGGQGTSGAGVRASGDVGVDVIDSRVGLEVEGASFGAIARGRVFGLWGIADGSPTPDRPNYAVYGTTTGGAGQFAGYFSGRTHVAGTLSKQAGSFKIDHPLDPAKKWLSHSFVESPDMMNVYNGNVVLDREGAASVELPAYFTALNRDYRYQLTPIGGAAPDLHVAAKVQDNRFRIAGGPPGLEVSWLVTGIRKDDYAAEHPIVVEEPKVGAEKGTRAFVPKGSSARGYDPLGG